MITYIGYITFLLVLFNYNNKYNLLKLFVIFSAFSASTILIIPNSKFGLQPSYVIAIVFMLQFINMKSIKFLNHKYEKNIFIFIFIFMFIGLVSLLYPLVFNFFQIPYQVISPAHSYAYKPEFGSLSQYIYLIFYLLIVIFIYFFINSFDKLETLIKIFIYTSLFTAFWGLGVQESSVYLKFDYPYYIFNNHPGYAQGYAQEIYGYINRMCSVAQEPSVYAYFLSYSVSILTYLSLKNVYIMNKNYQKLILYIFILTLIVTTSSTAYTFLILLYFSMLILFFNINEPMKLNKRFIYLLFNGLFFLIVIYIVLDYILETYLNFSLFDLLSQLLFHKFDTGSGIERLNGFIVGINILLDTYLLGLGYGLNRTFDIVSTLLANIGIIGLLSFILMLLYPIFRIHKLKKKLYSKRQRAIVESIVIAFSFSFLLMAISIPDFNNIYFWLFFAFIISIPKIIILSLRKAV
jgi:hypothetical protein